LDKVAEKRGLEATDIRPADNPLVDKPKSTDKVAVPKGEQVWIVVEPGMRDVQDQFDKLFHTGH
jgi:hypothetical protein